MHNIKMHNTEPIKTIIKHELSLINKEIKPSGIKILV
jgi:hypothetical protein